MTDANERRGPSGKAEDIPAGSSASRTQRPRLSPRVVLHEFSAATTDEEIARVLDLGPGVFCDVCGWAAVDCICTGE